MPLRIFADRLRIWIDQKLAMKTPYTGDWTLRVTYESGIPAHVIDFQEDEFARDVMTTNKPYTEHELSVLITTSVQCLKTKIEATVTSDFWGEINTHVRLESGRYVGVRCSSKQNVVRRKI